MEKAILHLNDPPRLLYIPFQYCCTCFVIYRTSLFSGTVLFNACAVEWYASSPFSPGPADNTTKDYAFPALVRLRLGTSWQDGQSHLNVSQGEHAVARDNLASKPRYHTDGCSF